MVVGGGGWGGGDWETGRERGKRKVGRLCMWVGVRVWVDAGEGEE